MIIKQIVNHKDDGIITPNRLFAAWQVSKNWRITQRLPRLSKLAYKLYGNKFSK